MKDSVSVKEWERVHPLRRDTVSLSHIAENVKGIECVSANVDESGVSEGESGEGE